MEPDQSETSQNCQIIILSPEYKGEGDGSGVKPEQLLVCSETT